MKLFKFQKDGVKFLKTHSRAILNDEAGLGKTAQAIMALPAKKPVLVICPMMVMTTWMREFKRLRPDLAVTNKVAIIEPNAATLSYVKRIEDWMNTPLQPPRPDSADVIQNEDMTIIVDEAHHFARRARPSERTANLVFREITITTLKNGGRIWLLTGKNITDVEEAWRIVQCAGFAPKASNRDEFLKTCLKDGTLRQLGAAILRRTQTEIRAAIPKKS